MSNQLTHQIFTQHSNSSISAAKAELTEQEWRIATQFDSTDWGWIIMSIGMAIGAGIVFLPVKIGILGVWVFLLSAILGYPAMYLFQRLFIHTLAASKECVDYPSVIAGYLGKNWGILIGTLYFVMLVIWVFIYSTAITNDSASFIQSFGLTKTLLSDHPLYGLVLVIGLVALASRGEKFLFKMATGMVLSKLFMVAFLGLAMIPHWNPAHIEAPPATANLIKEAVVLLPFTLTSILFIQSLSPMVISYRVKEKSIEVARFKALRAMNIAFGILVVVVFFYVISFTLAMSHEQAVKAANENISALAMVVQSMSGPGVAASTSVKMLSLLLNIFAVMTAYFGVFLGFREACQGIALNLLRRIMPEARISKRLVGISILIFAVLVSWGAIVLNAPVLNFTSICSPIFGLIGCLIPAYLVYKVPRLHKYKGVGLWVIIITGMLLIISPFLVFS